MLTAYPAVFVKEEDGGYSVLFPDFEGGATCGDTLQDALEMAEECLAGLLAAMQEDKEPLPEPSEMTPELLSKTCAEVEADPSKAFWNMVTADVPAYARQHFEKSVKKTLTIPAWMNDAALKQGINFSQVLQEALSQKLSHA